MTGHAAHDNILDARLGGGRQRNRLTVAPEAGGDPKDRQFPIRFYALFTHDLTIDLYYSL